MSAPAEGQSGKIDHFRIGTDVKVGSVRAGSESVDDRRGEVSFAYAPIADLELSLAVPALLRTIHERGLPNQTTFVAGDTEVGATGAIWSSREGASQRLALSGGLKLPMAPLERDELGRPLGSVLQPGCNSVTPNLGVFYAMAKGRWAFDVGVSFYLPIAVRTAPHSGDSLRSHVGVELRPNRWLSARAGLTTRFEPSGELFPSITDPNSGGFIVSTASELRVSPVPRLTLHAAVYSPVVQLLRGSQHVGSTFSGGVSATF